MNIKEKCIILAEGSREELPLLLYQNLDWSKWNLNKNDYGDLKNKNSKDYWDSFNELIIEAEYCDEHGVWTLESNDSQVYLVLTPHFCEELVESDWEYSNGYYCYIDEEESDDLS